MKRTPIIIPKPSRGTGKTWQNKDINVLLFILYKVKEGKIEIEQAEKEIKELIIQTGKDCEISHIDVKYLVDNLK